MCIRDRLVLAHRLGHDCADLRSGTHADRYLADNFVVNMEHNRETGALKTIDCNGEVVSGGSLNDILDELRPIGLNTAPTARRLNRSFIGNTVVVDSGLDVAQLSTVRKTQLEQRPLPVSYTHLDVYKRQE